MTATADVTVTGLTTPQNVRTVQRYDFLFPLVGNWSALLDMSGHEVLPDGAVNIQLGRSTLRGYVTRAGDDRGQYVGVVVGGRATTSKQGLDKPVTAQHYYQTPASAVLSATLSQVGETLSPSSTGLSTIINYPRRAVSCDRVLDDIADMLGLVWRVQLDGSVWFGSYTWPASNVEFTYLNKQPDMAMVLVMPSSNQKVIEPGQTVVLDKSASASAIDQTPQRVAVANYYGDQRSQHCKMWLQNPDTDWLTDDKLAPDSLHAGLANIARAACRKTDWYRQFQGSVVTQRANGTVDVTLDRTFDTQELPPIRGAALSGPVGGSSITTRPGDRVTVYFEGGDPRRARCGLFETGGGTLGVARQTDTVGPSAAMTTWMTQVAAFINGIAPGTVAPPSVVTIGTITSASGDLKLRQ